MNGPHDPRTPPRFVPTLTEVVDLPEGLVAALAMPAPLVDAPSEQPPSYGEPPVAGAPVVALPPPTADTLDAWADLITQRVLLQLEQHLPALLQRQAADVVARLTDGVSQQLRSELPHMVHAAVRASFPATEAHSPGEPQRGFSAMSAADIDPG